MAAAAAMVGGGIIGAYGQMYQGHAAKQAGEFNAQVAEQNAELAIKQAKEEEVKFRSVMKRQLGDMRAAIGASGITLEGSPLEVIEDSAAQAEMDAISIRKAGEMKAHTYRTDAKLQRFQGEMGLQGSYYGAASSLLMAGGQAAGYGARR